MINKRHELKYMINKMEYHIIVNKLSKILNRDNNSINNNYTVSSLYFDNFNNKAYHDKLNGEAIRHKFRVRYYNNNTERLKLEQKSKINQITIKQSVLLTKLELTQIFKSNFNFLLAKNHLLYYKFYQQLQHELLKPKVIVKYQREAFIHKAGRLRITFDKQVKTANNQTNIFAKNLKFIDAIDPSIIIMEIKFNEVLPSFIKGILECAHTRQIAASKYVFSRKYNAIF
ncbi:polyphosphate polymerase domain-containing protein [Clostridium sp. 'deep sea']|uniref:polyphosphate polymerase domain-containing protein n=1 Tax=Clostridium sp. 'deep sea' TaxID=2779445 RepID=UPI00189659BD|nr:polyphosphate polymerase domain-containing protein [Clostridium sp. 'deep sea']QOR36573.1 polyphosphate polymerase domain-containing protein [Clostridium sp. 'deep sea']